MDMTAFWCFSLGALGIFLIGGVHVALAFLTGAGTGALSAYLWAQENPWWWAFGAFALCVAVVLVLFGRGGRGGGGGGLGGDLIEGVGDVVGSVLD